MHQHFTLIGHREITGTPIIDVVEICYCGKDVSLRLRTGRLSVRACGSLQCIQSFQRGEPPIVGSESRDNRRADAPVRERAATFAHFLSTLKGFGGFPRSRTGMAGGLGAPAVYQVISVQGLSLGSSTGWAQPGRVIRSALMRTSDSSMSGSPKR